MTGAIVMIPALSIISNSTWCQRRTDKERAAITAN
jgi:hypothetical protein